MVLPQASGTIRSPSLSGMVSSDLDFRWTIRKEDSDGVRLSGR